MSWLMVGCPFGENLTIITPPVRAPTGFTAFKPHSNPEGGFAGEETEAQGSQLVLESQHQDVGPGCGLVTPGPVLLAASQPLLDSRFNHDSDGREQCQA